MPDSITTSQPIPSDVAELQDKFTTSTTKNQLQMLPQMVATGLPGVEILIKWLQQQLANKPTIITGGVYQSLYHSEFPAARDYLDL